MNRCARVRDPRMNLTAEMINYTDFACHLLIHWSHRRVCYYLTLQEDEEHISNAVFCTELYLKILTRWQSLCIVSEHF